MKKVINVKLLGFQGFRYLKSLKYLIEKHDNSKYKFIVTDSDARLTIVDADTVEGQDFLSRHETGTRIYVASEKPLPELNQYQYLSKPIKPEAIHQLLDAVDSKSTGDAITDKKSPQLQSKSSPSKEPVKFYQPVDYLQGRILSALTLAKNGDDCIRFIKPFTQSDLMMTLSVRDRLVYLPDGPKKLDKFYGIKLTGTDIKTEVVQFDKNHKKKLFNSTSMDLDKLIWDASMGASLGRLPVDTDMNKTIKMKYWPNLSRVKPKRGFAQIAALWTQNSYSINQVRHYLPQYATQVNLFYSAASSLDLFEGVDYVTPDKSHSQADKNLFNKLLKWIRS